MASPGIMMCPVHDPSLWVPFIFSVKFNHVSGLEIWDSIRQINVMRNEDRLSGFKLENEALMFRTFQIIRENPLNSTTTLNLNITASLLEGFG